MEIKPYGHLHGISDVTLIDEKSCLVMFKITEQKWSAVSSYDLFVLVFSHEGDQFNAAFIMRRHISGSLFKIPASFNANNS